MNFLNELNKEQLTLVVSCPINDYNYIKAAWENGADAVKIHLNVHHHASGTDFKSYQEELELINQVLNESPIPVGVVIGGDPAIVNKEIPNIVNSGFDFLSLYLHDATPAVQMQNKVTKMYACNYTYSFEEIKYFNEAGAQVCEVSIIDPNDYGKPLNMRDILRYTIINQNSSIPTLLPTQKNIQPSELNIIKQTGFNAIMIGAVVTGKEFDGYCKTIKTFREAIDKL